MIWIKGQLPKPIFFSWGHLCLAICYPPRSVNKFLPTLWTNNSNLIYSIMVNLNWGLLLTYDPWFRIKLNIFIITENEWFQHRPILSLKDIRPIQLVILWLKKHSVHSYNCFSSYIKFYSIYSLMICYFFNIFYLTNFCNKLNIIQ